MQSIVFASLVYHIRRKELSEILELLEKFELHNEIALFAIATLQDLGVAK